MTFDLAHALVAGVLIFAVITGMQKTGLYISHKDGGPRWSWPLFFGIAAAMFVLNLVWP
jgi:hypothetical protein